MTSKISTLKNSILIATFALLPLAAVEASAQTKSVTVDVPFAFVANHTSMPAGNYRILDYNDQLTFINADTGISRAIVLSRTESGTSAEEFGKLEFYVSGSRHMLTEVHFGGTSTHAVLLRQPRPEKVIARNGEPAGQYLGIASR
jgi:hypothetical protein